MTIDYDAVTDAMRELNAYEHRVSYMRNNPQVVQIAVEAVTHSRNPLAAVMVCRTLTGKSLVECVAYMKALGLMNERSNA